MTVLACTDTNEIDCACFFFSVPSQDKSSKLEAARSSHAVTPHTIHRGIRFETLGLTHILVALEPREERGVKVRSAVLFIKVNDHESDHHNLTRDL